MPGAHRPRPVAYRAYGVGQWPVERILYDAPAAFWAHDRERGAGFQEKRRETGRPLVDDPWRAAAEFVVRPDGTVRLPYLYQYCDGFPDPRVLTTAARLSGRASGGRPDDSMARWRRRADRDRTRGRAGEPHRPAPRAAATGAADGRRYRFRSRKSWALLAYLVLSERPPTRGQLASLLFAEADDPIRALRWSLAEIRRGLGDGGVVDGDPVVLRLPAGTVVDVDVLVRTGLAAGRRAAGLGADLLDGVAVANAPRFRAWLLSERRQLAAATEAVLHEAALGLDVARATSTRARPVRGARRGHEPAGREPPGPASSGSTASRATTPRPSGSTPPAAAALRARARRLGRLERSRRTARATGWRSCRGRRPCGARSSWPGATPPAPAGPSSRRSPVPASSATPAGRASPHAGWRSWPRRTATASGLRDPGRGPATCRPAGRPLRVARRVHPRRAVQPRPAARAPRHPALGGRDERPDRSDGDARAGAPVAAPRSSPGRRAGARPRPCWPPGSTTLRSRLCSPGRRSPRRLDVGALDQPVHHVLGEVRVPVCLLACRLGVLLLLHLHPRRLPRRPVPRHQRPQESAET